MTAMKDRILEIAPRALQKWGSMAMIVKATEELAELQVQCCKVLGGSPTTDDAVIDEIADVSLMVTRLALHYGPALVETRIAYKLDRLEKALDRADV